MNLWQIGLLKVSLLLFAIGFQLSLALDIKPQHSHHGPTLTSSHSPSRPTSTHGPKATSSTSLGFHLQQVMCPEMVGADPWYCNDDWCGGEAPNVVPSVCIKKGPRGCTCRCTPGSAPDANPNITTVVLPQTATNGVNLTATYTRISLSDYSDLRKEKTLTTVVDTSVGTATNGVAEPLATVVGVVGAGGVMWVLASVFAAGAEVGELIGGEPFIPEDGFDDGTDGDDDDDDTTDDSDDECPDENPKCFETDCNGNYLGLCTTAPNINCPCDECPPVERFFCSEEECKGEGEDENFLGTCKAEGSHKGCSCSYPACPIVRIDLDNGKTEDRPDRLSCSDCGGSVGLGHPDAFHCKGIKSTSSDKFKYQNCDCLPFSDSGPFIDFDGEGLSEATKALSDVWAVNSTWDLDTSFHLAGYSCPLTSPGARKTYGGANDDYSTPESVKEAIDSFCAKYKGADAEYSWSDVFLVASPQDDYPEHRTPTWLTVRKWKDAPASHNCSATNAMANYTIDFNECTQALYVANFACSVDNSTLTHGGSQPGFCLAYEIVTSEVYTPNTRPWDTQDKNSRLECGDGGVAGNKATAVSGVESSFWVGVPTKFCQSASEGWSNYEVWVLTSDDWESNDATVDSFTGNKTTVPMNTPPTKYGNPWRFKFLAYKARECQYADCIKAYQSVQKSSCGHQSTNYHQIASEGQYEPPAWQISRGCKEDGASFEWRVDPPLTYNSAVLTNLSDLSNYPSGDNSIAPANLTADDLYYWNVSNIFCNSNLIIPHPLPTDPYDKSRAALEISLAPPQNKNGRMARIEATFAGDREGGVGALGNECVNMNSPEAGVNSGGIQCVDMLNAAIWKLGLHDTNQTAAGVISMEHEDPRGCVVYSIVAYNRDYRMFAAASTGGFLEPWSGGDSSTWRDGTQVFKGSRTSKGNGTSVAEGKKQPHAKVRLFE